MTVEVSTVRVTVETSHSPRLKPREAMATYIATSSYQGVLPRPLPGELRLNRSDPTPIAPVLLLGGRPRLSRVYGKLVC